MKPSLDLLGGGSRHSEHYRHFNHEPERKPWSVAGAVAPRGVAEIVTLYMGAGFPVECVEGDIIEAISHFADLGPENGLDAYLKSIGDEGRAVLAAIKRNFRRRPELWRKAVS